MIPAVKQLLTLYILENIEDTHCIYPWVVEIEFLRFLTTETNVTPHT